jgi:hypothetical protein
MAVLAALLLATALPLGLWPETSGPAAALVDEVEFYQGRSRLAG